MTYQRTVARLSLDYPVLDMVSTLGPWGPPVSAHPALSTASNPWEAAARTIYHPLYVPTKCQVKRLWWANGSLTTGGATVTAAIYKDKAGAPGAQIVAQSATQGTALNIQFVTPATIPGLIPGLYWIALYMSSATNTTAMRNNLNLGNAVAIKYQEAAVPPTTATPVRAVNSSLYLCGFSTVASP
jgi:hypothetical protein